MSRWLGAACVGFAWEGGIARRAPAPAAHACNSPRAPLHRAAVERLPWVPYLIPCRLLCPPCRYRKLDVLVAAHRKHGSLQVMAARGAAARATADKKKATLARARAGAGWWGEGGQPAAQPAV